MKRIDTKLPGVCILEPVVHGEDVYKRQLARNTVIVTIGKICTQFLNFFLLPV